MDADKRKHFAGMLARVAYLYDVLLETHGTSNNAVGWSRPDIHEASIRTLLNIIEPDGRDDISINDFGCGYGYLFELIRNEPWIRKGRYYGYDINESMTAQLKKRYASDVRVEVAQSMEPYWEADYSIAAGTFNCSMQAERKDWEELIQVSLHALWQKSRQGMAVSFLHDQVENQDPDIIYLNPDKWVAFCKEMFTPQVECLMDHPEGQFALLLRRYTKRN